MNREVLLDQIQMARKLFITRPDLARTYMDEAITALTASSGTAEQPQKYHDDLAHELWATAQLAPDEGIEDGVDRIALLLAEQPQKMEGGKMLLSWPIDKRLDDFAVVANSLIAEGQESRAQVVYYLIERCRLAEQTPEPSLRSKEERAVVSREAIQDVLANEHVHGDMFITPEAFEVLINEVYALQLPAQQPTAEIEEVEPTPSDYHDAEWDSDTADDFIKAVWADNEEETSREDDAHAHGFFVGWKSAIAKLKEAKHGQ